MPNGGRLANSFSDMLLELTMASSSMVLRKSAATNNANFRNTTSGAPRAIHSTKQRSRMTYVNSRPLFLRIKDWLKLQLYSAFNA